MPPLPGLSPAAPAFPGMLPLPGVPPLPGRPPLPGMPPLPGLPPFVRQSVAGPFPPFSSAITPALSMMLPLLVLPKMLEDPGSVFAAMALRPALQSGQVGQIIRGALFNGGDPKYSDQMVRGMVMPTALFSQIANTLAQVRTGATTADAPPVPSKPLLSNPRTPPRAGVEPARHREEGRRDAVQRLGGAREDEGGPDDRGEACDDRRRGGAVPEQGYARSV